MAGTLGGIRGEQRSSPTHLFEDFGTLLDIGASKHDGAGFSRPSSLPLDPVAICKDLYFLFEWAATHKDPSANGFNKKLQQHAEQEQGGKLASHAPAKRALVGSISCVEDDQRMIRSPRCPHKTIKVRVCECCQPATEAEPI
jgi:hypothetical protein